MSPRDFDRHVGVYLDGEATRAQVMALRKALRERPELKSRLADLVRLHRAQSAALTRRARPSLAVALGQLRAIADRAGRSLAHACLLVLVCVELDVALPRVDSQSWVNGGRPVPALVPVSEVIGSDMLESVMGGEPAADMMPAEGDMADPMAAESTGAMPVLPDTEALSEG